MHRTVGERIKDRRKQLGLSPDRIAAYLGRDRSTYFRYEGNEIKSLPSKVLNSLAEILGVSEHYLLSGEKQSVRKLPIIGDIAAGEPIFASENHEDHMEVDSSIDADFILRVSGDSMIDARICDGDLVFVRVQPAVENGEIAAVLIDDSATLKRVYRSDDGVILKAENSSYAPMLFTKQDFLTVRVLGKAVMFQSKIE